MKDDSQGRQQGENNNNDNLKKKKKIPQRVETVSQRGCRIAQGSSSKNAAGLEGSTIQTHGNRDRNSFSASGALSVEGQGTSA